MNQGPAGYEPDALTAELEAHMHFFFRIRRTPCMRQIPRKSGRGDTIRTCGLLVPNQLRYQAALHPVIVGRGRRIRTLDTRFWRPLLYQLSYTPIKVAEKAGFEPARP